MHILVIDVGSSSARALLVDTHTLQVIPHAIARRTYQFTHQPEGAAQIDAAWLREQVEACIDELLTQHSDKPIEAVGMTTFVGNLVGVDASSNPLTPLYTYADTRAKAHLAPLADELDTNAAYQRTGCPHHVAYHPAWLRWLNKTDPDTCRRVDKWIDFGTYCYRVWFNADVPCSYSVASWSGMMNRHTLQWDDEWLRVLDFSVERLPSLADCYDVQQGLCPAFGKRWTALRDVPFHLAVGDGAVSNLGSGGTTPDKLVMTVGTTAAVRLVTTEAPDPLPTGLWNYRVDAAHHLVGGATTEGGNIFAWAQDTLQLNGIEAALAQLPPDAHGLTVLPMLGGERSPGYASDAVGTIHGIRFSTEPIYLLQAMLESVALRLATIADLLAPPELSIYAGGGSLSASHAFAQIIANATNRTLHLIDEQEVAARGVALLVSHSIENAPPPATANTLIPDSIAAARYTVARKRQRELYKMFYSQER